MRILQNKSRFISIGEAFINDKDAGNDNKNALNIKQANLIDISLIFKEFNIKLNDYMRKIRCPLPGHNDKSASFYYYKDTNSFYCFGCKSGGGPVEFISLMDGFNKIEAAKRIIIKFDTNQEYIDDTSENYIYNKQLSLEFSALIKSFIDKNLDDNRAIFYCEKITLVFDTITTKHKVDGKGLKSLIDKLKIKLDQYKCE